MPPLPKERLMGYQPRGPAFDPANHVPPPSGSGVVMVTGGYPHKPVWYCRSCRNLNTVQCPFEGKVHPSANCKDCEERNIRIPPFPTKMPTGGVRVMK